MDTGIVMAIYGILSVVILSVVALFATSHQHNSGTATSGTDSADNDFARDTVFTGIDDSVRWHGKHANGRAGKLARKTAEQRKIEQLESEVESQWQN